jgi:eukaryotic translation initiation factor 2C
LALLGAIKSYCEISGADFGVISQVLQGVTMAKIGGQPPNRNVLKNVILKINAKLGGTNNRISQESDRFGDKLQSWSKFTNPREPTLWIGVDVTHPSKDESGLESIAAVASNLDIHATQFRGSWALQEGNNIEQVRELQRLVFDAVEKFFEANNRKLPHHLVIVRDGLSNSQMVQFGAYEMSKIGAACKEVAQKSGLTFTPTITYIVVQKRHGTRFLLSDNQENMEGSDPYYGRYNGNVRPGTVVDNTVTGNVYPNFFLCSHKGQLGTSRPAHYTILHNNWNLEMNDWQEAMFLLCHLIARSITPVSIPVPVYYAHLLCSRVRKYILAVKDEEGPAYRMDMIQIHASIQGQQFFI